MENGNSHTVKLAGAVSMESLDNCSIISSIDQASQVRTLFVSGLPMDARSRELYLLFRGCAGYEASQLKITNKNGKAMTPVGFVTFNSHQDADEAKRQLQGIRFDPESSQTLRLELARSNTKVTKPKQISPPIISPNHLINANSASAGILAAPPTATAAAATIVNPTIPLACFGPSVAQNAAAAAYAAAAQQAMTAAATAAPTATALDNNSLAASMLALNSAPMDQLSMLSALSESHHQQQLQQQAIQQLVPFIAASQAASYQLYTPISGATAIGNGAIPQQFPGQQQQQQQAALAAAMVQLQQHGQQSHLAAMNSLVLPQQLATAQQQSNAQTAAIMAAAAAASATNGSGVSAGLAQPCSTLFVANLGANINEEELRELFKKYPGFSRLRMHTKGGSPVAFVEYHDVRQAAVALSGLHGYQLSTSGGGAGIRIEFARTKMGEGAHSGAHVNHGSAINGSTNISLNVS